jgi:hypothetical protein
MIPTTLATQRFFAGMGTQRPTNTDVAFAAGQRFSAIRFSTVAGDTNFQPFTWDGAAVVISPTTLLPVVVDREYLLIMNYNKGGLSVLFRLFDIVTGASATVSMQVPAAMRGLGAALRQGMFINIFSQDAGLDQFAIQTMYYEAGNS